MQMLDIAIGCVVRATTTHGVVFFGEVICIYREFGDMPEQYLVRSFRPEPQISEEHPCTAWVTTVDPYVLIRKEQGPVEWVEQCISEEVHQDMLDAWYS